MAKLNQSGQDKCVIVWAEGNKTAWGLNRGRKASEWCSLSIKSTLIGSQQSFSDRKWHSVQCFSCLTFSERETRLRLIVGSLYTLTHTQSIVFLFLENRLRTALTFSHSLLLCVSGTYRTIYCMNCKRKNMNHKSKLPHNTTGIQNKILTKNLISTEICHYIRNPRTPSQHSQ